ncbi:DUF4199 domain-containing protein [Pontibacter qinzhouensis]|uniref:DUF4199 domain-containing protein n=1 Tax=Pontibacter qinzhouensis TaxID=2603253 RepID=A0A5C8K9N5_9BACT|nr:DUF4199 domain-containing protein [Pontibacter qinzhouensis]TXK48600.1 DUF4199 domain-containing protein [Pontibacter qinzhouensis]
MIEKQPSVASVALKYGLAGGVIAVLYSAILMIFGQSTNKWLAFLSYFILVGAMVVAMQQFKKENQGFMSYGQGLGLGTLVATIIGVLSGVFTVIYTTFVDPDYMANIMDQQRMELEDRGMSDEQIDAALAIGESMSGPFMTLVMSIFGFALIGLLLSLVISAIMKKNRPQFE